MTATFRKSQMAQLLSLLAKCADGEVSSKEKKELFEQLVMETTEKVKNDFVGKLSPIEYEAYRLGYLVIEEQLTDIRFSSNEEIKNKWFIHFLKMHDEILALIKSGEIFKYAIDVYGEEYVNNIFRQDTREVPELISIIAEAFAVAKVEKEKHKEALKEKLHKQLIKVVSTLNELTSEKDGVKKFEIETDNAMFNIVVNTDEQEEQEEASSKEEPLEDLFELLKKLIEEK